MGKKVILLIFMCMFLIGFVSAIKSTQVNTGSEGLEIFYPQFEVIEQYQTFNLHIHISNISNGYVFNNTQTDCFLHLYNRTGDHTLERNTPLLKDGNKYDHELFIDSGNFSSLGLHAFLIWCNSTDGSGFGGEAKGSFEVTPSGFIFSESQSILYICLFFVLFSVFMITLFVIDKLPKYNQQDEEGRILSVSYLKYFRPVLWFLEWMLFVGSLYISSNLAFAYLNEQLFAKVLFTLFKITFGITPIIVIVWMTWIFVNMFHDKQFQQMLNRGIFPEGKL